MSIFDINGNVINTGSVFINVKDFGAKGDGTSNDATAIQNAFDALKNTGGIIYFPNGTYNLGASVLFYSNQTLLFENGAIIKATSSSVNNLFRSYCDNTVTGYNGVHDVFVFGGTFDGSGHGLNNTLFGVVHSKNIIISNCAFLNGRVGYHNLEINSSYNVRITNCRFTRSGNGSENGEMIQLDTAISAGWPWDNINGDGTQCKYICIDNCHFSENTLSPAIGRHNGTPQFIRIHDNIFDGLTSVRGAIDLSAVNVDIYNNIFNSCDIGIGSEGVTHYIHDNRFVDATTAISGTSSVAHNNMINGTFTA